MKRCDWVSAGDLISERYHDEEWGVPVHDDRVLFEFLVLEGAQAGLNWSTILKKREGYRKAFADFDPLQVAAFSNKKCEQFLENPGIIRNRLKVFSAVKNAVVFLEIQQECGSFDAYLWGYVKGEPIQNHFEKLSEIPARTPLSEQISKDLKKRGMSFVGSTIIYAYLQAIGVVNDHTRDCFRYRS